MTPQPLRRSTLLLYGLPAVGMTAMLWLVMFYLLKYSSTVLGLSPAIVGALFGLGRLWDGVSDPAVGYWSDRTRSRVGRRRPWMIAAALPTSLAFVALWCPPAGLGGDALVLWLGAAMLLFYSALTAIAVPHWSLGAELSSEHHARTGIFASRAAFEMVGMLVAIGGLHLLENAADPRATAFAVAAAIGALTLLGVWGSAAALRERPEHRGRGATRPLRAFADVWRNEHARILFAVFFLSELGVGSLAAALPFMTEHLMDARGQSALYLLAFLAPAVLSIPVWTRISRRIGKRDTWLVASAIATTAFAAMFHLNGAPGPIFLVCAAIGATQGAIRTIPHSIKADVIDVDELRTGERKEGAYFAAWNLLQKAAGGVAIAIMGAVLSLSGVAAGGEVDPTGIRVVTGVMPAAFLCAATVLLTRLRFDETEHRAVQDRLDGIAARVRELRVTPG